MSLKLLGCVALPVTLALVCLWSVSDASWRDIVRQAGEATELKHSAWTSLSWAEGLYAQPAQIGAPQPFQPDTTDKNKQMNMDDPYSKDVSEAFELGDGIEFSEEGDDAGDGRTASGRRSLSDSESSEAPPRRKRRDTDLQERMPDGLKGPPADGAGRGDSFRTASVELVPGSQVSSYVLIKKLRDLGTDGSAPIPLMHIEYYDTAGLGSKEGPHSPTLSHSAPLWPAQYGAIPSYFGGLLAASPTGEESPPPEFDLGEYADELREDMSGMPPTDNEQRAIDIVMYKQSAALDAAVGASPTTMTVRRQAGPVESSRRKYKLREKFAKGAYGEVWRAVRPGDGAHYILKRMFVEKGDDVRLSGLREIHYGRKLRSLGHIARFVEYFEGGGSDAGSELWLVFHDEGIALHEFLYSRIDDGAFARMERSLFWRRLKTDPNGAPVMKAIMKQLLTGIAICHEHNVTHRDIKPENLILSYINERPELMLADFGSAVERDFPDHLYPPEGPSKDEATLDYAPPEVTFSMLPFDSGRPESYDIWSAGIVFMEMILGTPKVFTIDDRARARIDLQMQDKSEEVKEAAYRFKAMQQYCLYPPNSEATLDEESLSDMLGTSVMKPKCTKETFFECLRRHDPLGIGLEDRMGVDLLKRLLAFDPRDRIMAREGLTHAYFTRDDGEAYKCTVCGREFPLGTQFAKHVAEHSHR